jgi:hypothetical protein
MRPRRSTGRHSPPTAARADGQVFDAPLPHGSALTRPLHV